jgi:hypothetical protein
MGAYMKTYNDAFVEHLIRRSRPGGETLFKAGAILIGLILGALAFWWAGGFFSVIFTVIVILEFFAFVYTVKEYEYSFINGDFDVDMIQGKRKRRQVLSTSCKEIKLMAPADSGKYRPEGSFNNTYDFSVSKNSPGRWFFIIEREDGTRNLVYFNPNERLLKAFKDYLNKKMEYEIKNNEING